MEELTRRIGECIERGKVNRSSPYPSDMQGQDGSDELTRQALDSGIGPEEILQACNDGMKRIGDRFSRNEVFVPELLMAAKSMNAVMAHLKPYFQTGTVKAKALANSSVNRFQPGTFRWLPDSTRSTDMRPSLPHGRRRCDRAEKVESGSAARRVKRAARRKGAAS